MLKLIPVDELAEMLRLESLGERGLNQVQAASEIGRPPETLRSRAQAHGFKLVSAVQVRAALTGERFHEMVRSGTIGAADMPQEPRGLAAQIRAELAAPQADDWQLLRAVRLLEDAGLEIGDIGLVIGWDPRWLREKLRNLGYSDFRPELSADEDRPGVFANDSGQRIPLYDCPGIESDPDPIEARVA